MFVEDPLSIKSKIMELNRLLQTQEIKSDDDNLKMVMDELDGLLYKYYKALSERMRNIEGDGDGI